MKHAKNEYLVVIHLVCNSIVSVLENANIFGGALVSVARLWKHQERLGAIVNSIHDPFGGLWVVRVDVFKDILQPALRFFCPD